MNAILIICHAPLAHALRECALHVFSDCGASVGVVDVQPNLSPEETLATARIAMEQLRHAPQVQGVLVLRDIFGATPSNVVELLRAHGTPQQFAALNVDVDGDELPLIEAILAADYSPSTIALTINPDIPPPIQLRTRLMHPSPAGRALVGAAEPCDTWPCSTSALARLRAAGLSGPSGC